MAELTPARSRPAELARLHFLIASGQARLIREQANVPQSAIAQEIDASTTAVSRWERGQRVPHGDVAIAYLGVLDEILAAGTGGDLPATAAPSTRGERDGPADSNPALYSTSHGPDRPRSAA